MCTIIGDAFELGVLFIKMHKLVYLRSAESHCVVSTERGLCGNKREAHAEKLNVGVNCSRVLVVILKIIRAAVGHVYIYLMTR